MMESSTPSNSGPQRRLQLRRIDQLCDQYEELCETQAYPKLPDFLSTIEKPLPVGLVDELIRIDLHHQIDAGIDIDIDDYAKRLAPFQSLVYQVFNSLHDEKIAYGSLCLREQTYEVGDKIGSGGMAQIFRGFDHRLNRPVAIKMLRSDLVSDRIAVERFENEAKMVAALRQEGVVQIYDVGVRQGALMIVFELMEGGTLREQITRQPIPIRQCAEYGRTIAAIIHQAHEIGVIHLDLKPSNILLTKSGSLKVGDFGLARLADHVPSLGMTGEVFGTVNYMAPEQADGNSHRVDRRTDVYGIGAVLYELLTGSPPFAGDSNRQTIQRLIRHNTVPPRGLRREIPYDLDRICMRCLSKNPVDRYQSAGALEKDLTAFLESRPTAANPPGPIGRLWRWTRRNSAIAVTAAIAGVLIVSILIATIGSIVEERNRFRNQRDAAVANLYDSLVGQARAIRLAGRNNFRVQAYEKIREAIALNASNTDRLELRNEIVASMGQFVGQQPAVWTTRGSPNMFVSSAIQPDRSHIALGLFSGDISIRQVASGQEVQRLSGHTSGVFELVISPQGDRMASADDLGEIRIWTKKRDGAWKFDSVLRCTPTARPQYVKSHSLAFSADGKTLFSCPFGGREIKRWDLHDPGTAVISQQEYHSPIDMIRFSISADSSLLALGTIENTVILWNRQTRTVERTVRLKNAQQLLDVAISPDKQWLAIGTRNGGYVYHLVSGEPVLSIPGDHLITLSFSPDSQFLALPSEDLNLVRVWHIHSRREVAVLENDAYEATFSADGDLLVCVSAGQAVIWNLQDTSTPMQFTARKKGVTSLAFAPDGSLLSSDADRVFSVHRLSARQSLCEFPMSSEITSCYSPAKIAVFADEEFIEFYQLPVNENSKPMFRKSHGMGPQIAHAEITNQGRHFVAAGSRGVKIWTLAMVPDDDPWTLELAEEKSLFGARAGSLTVSDDEQIVAWVDAGGNIYGWDFSKQDRVPISELKGNMPDCLVFVPGTHTLIAADVYGAVRQFSFDHPSPLKLVGTTEEQTQADWQSVRLALAPNGRYLAIQRGRQIKIWDLENNCELVTLPQSDGLAWSMVWNPDSSAIALGYANGIVVAWQLDSINDHLRPLGLDWE